jgi:hypothetical protein
MFIELVPLIERRTININVATLKLRTYPGQCRTHGIGGG